MVCKTLHNLFSINCIEFLDVTKQRDLSGFYRHLYRQTFSEKSEVAEGKKDEGESKPSSSRAESTSQKNEDQKGRRQYRQRREESPEAASVEPEKGKEVSEASDHESEGEEERKTETIKEMAERRPAASSALLAAAASDREALANRKTAEQVEVDAAVSSSSAKHDRSRTHKRRKEADSSESDSSRSSSPSPKKKKKEAKENVAPKVKIDIWKKRNTGEVLEAAIERYQLRREARENGLVPWTWNKNCGIFLLIHPFTCIASLNAASIYWYLQLYRRKQKNRGEGPFTNAI